MRKSQREIHESSRRLGRRALILGGMQLVFVAGLGLRMRHLQIEKSDQFRLLAEENRINLRLIPPARGLIYDRDGTVIADNEQNYRIVMVREDAGDVDDTLARLSSLVPLDPEDLDRARKELKRRSPFVPVTVAERVPWEDIAKVAVNAPALPGISGEVGLSRVYPMKRDYAHILGYVGPVSDFDLSRIDDQDPLLQIPRFQIGKTGVEVKHERDLRGKAGNRQIEVNALGRVIRELDRIEGQPGDDLQLTVDTDLQNYVQARLEGEAASAVVMDTQTGDLLAIGSAPSFDPNLFVRGISSNAYNALRDNKYRPFRSKAVQDIYPPGSTFKMITALAALEDGVIGVDETVYCPGHTTVSGLRFHCWKRAGHGNMNLHDSLVQSCDVYYYDIAQRVGIEKISAMAKRFGIGVDHDLPMSAVASGLAPTKEWKRTVRDAEWRIGDTVNASIGQGYVLASPLQLAVMSARLASGRAISPRLIKSVNGVDTLIRDGGPLDVNANMLKRVQDAMFAVSNHRRGTGYRSRIIEDSYRMAGKTGTSQVRRITAEERARGVTRNEDLPWERRDHALWGNYAPYANPRIAVSVVVEHGGGGAKAAAPSGRDITLRALYGQVPPLEAYPTGARDDVQKRHDNMNLRTPETGDSTGRDRA